MSDMVGKGKPGEKSVTADMATMRDAEAYKTRLTGLGYAVEIEDMLSFPGTITLTLPNVPDEYQGKSQDLPPVEYDKFSDMMDGLVAQIGPLLRNPEAETYVQTAMKKAKA